MCTFAYKIQSKFRDLHFVLSNPLPLSVQLNMDLYSLFASFEARDFIILNSTIVVFFLPDSSFDGLHPIPDNHLEWHLSVKWEIATFSEGSQPSVCMAISNVARIFHLAAWFQIEIVDPSSINSK